LDLLQDLLVGSVEGVTCHVAWPPGRAL